MPIEAYVEGNYEVVPLARIFIQQIFCSTLEAKEKLDLLWDTLAFFEQSSRQQNGLVFSIQMDTCRYLLNSLVQKLCPSIPLNASDNITDLIFCGDAPVIYKAFFVIGDTFLDIKELIQTCVNHGHLTSGKKELDLSRPIVHDLIKEHLRLNHKKLTRLEEGEIYLQISTNLGLESHTIPFRQKSESKSLRTIFMNQNLRVQLANQQRNISRERFESGFLQYGLLSHLLQSSQEVASKGKYRVNSYAYMEGKWFESVVLCNEEDQVELFEQFPEWNRALFDIKLKEDQYLCFMLIRPEDLFLIHQNYLVFL